MKGLIEEMTEQEKLEFEERSKNRVWGRDGTTSRFTEEEADQIVRDYDKRNALEKAIEEEKKD